MTCALGALTLNYETPASGKLLINASTTVQSYSAANTPPTLPLEYVDFWAERALRPVSRAAIS